MPITLSVLFSREREREVWFTVLQETRFNGKESIRKDNHQTTSTTQSHLRPWQDKQTLLAPRDVITNDRPPSVAVANLIIEMGGQRLWMMSF